MKGRLQTFVSYGLSLTGILLSLLTIIISIYTVTSDIEQRQIYTVITKSIRRFEFLLGKLLGVILLDVILLSLFAAIIYTITIYTPKFVNTTEIERIQVNNEFFTARASLTVPPLDVSKEVEEAYKYLPGPGLPLVAGTVEDTLIDQMVSLVRSVKTGDAKTEARKG